MSSAAKTKKGGLQSSKNLKKKDTQKNQSFTKKTKDKLKRYNEQRRSKTQNLNQRRRAAMNNFNQRRRTAFQNANQRRRTTFRNLNQRRRLALQKLNQRRRSAFKKNPNTEEQDIARKPKNPNKSKNPQKNLPPKKRTPTEQKNRDDFKNKLLKNHDQYTKVKQGIIESSLPEDQKQARLNTAKNRYYGIQNGLYNNYRQRKVKLANYGLGPGYAWTGFYPYTTFTPVSSYGPIRYQTAVPQFNPSPFLIQGNAGTQSMQNVQPQMDIPQQPQKPLPASNILPSTHYDPGLSSSSSSQNSFFGGCVRSLVNVDGSHLALFLNARDAYMNEKNTQEQIRKGINLMVIAENIDKRYKTHAVEWGRIMKYRPPEWTRETAQKYANGLDADEMEKLSKMKGAEVQNYLRTMDPQTAFYVQQAGIYCNSAPGTQGETSTDTTSEVQETSDTQESAPVPEAVPVGCGIEPVRTVENSRSSQNNVHRVYFENEKIEVQFHISGLTEMFSSVQKNTEGSISWNGKNVLYRTTFALKYDQSSFLSILKMWLDVVNILPIDTLIQKEKFEFNAKYQKYKTSIREKSNIWVFSNHSQRYVRVEEISSVVLENYRKTTYYSDLLNFNNLVIQLQEVLILFSLTLPNFFSDLVARPSRSKQSVPKASTSKRLTPPEEISISNPDLKIQRLGQGILF